MADRTSDALRDVVGRYRQVRDGGVSSVYLRKPGIPHLLSAIGAIATQFPSRSVVVSLGVSAVAVWGIIADAREGNAVTAIAAAYAACLVLSVALPNRTFLFRNYLVVIPSLALAFGAGVEGVTRVARARCGSHRVLGAAVLGTMAVAGAVALVGLPLSDAIEAQRLHDDPRVRAIDWISRRASAEAPADVGITPGVFGKPVMGNYPELAGVLRRPELTFAAHEVESCPTGPSRPRYVIDASYRDLHLAPASDRWQEQWLFRDCPGYEQAATFELNPNEVNLGAYPTWPGRISAVVLRRRDQS